MKRIVAALVLALNASAGATVMAPVDVGELSRDADAIVRGRIAALASRWTDDGRGIETIVTLEAETYLKGSWGQSPQFKVPGGQLGRYRRIVVGAPQFSPGQRVIVFLGARAGNVPYVLGFSQGVFRVVEAASGWVVTPPAVIAAAGSSAPIVRGDLSRRPAPLADFERRIRALAVEAR